MEGGARSLEEGRVRQEIGTGGSQDLGSHGHPLRADARARAGRPRGAFDVRLASTLVDTQSRRLAQVTEPAADKAVSTFLDAWVGFTTPAVFTPFRLTPGTEVARYVEEHEPKPDWANQTVEKVNYNLRGISIEELRRSLVSGRRRAWRR